MSSRTYKLAAKIDRELSKTSAVSELLEKSNSGAAIGVLSAKVISRAYFWSEAGTLMGT